MYRNVNFILNVVGGRALVLFFLDYHHHEVSKGKLFFSLILLLYSQLLKIVKYVMYNVDPA